MTLYDLVYALAIGLTSPIWLASPKLRRKVLDAFQQRKGVVPISPNIRPGLLIHAVSMGEINATTALVRQLSEAEPELRFIVSTTSRTGAERARELYEQNPRVTLVRFPFDFSRNIRRLISGQRPRGVVLMELEVWPNFMRECARHKIPVMLINGRLSAHSFRNYLLALPLTRPMFRRLTLACVQEETYARRFRRLGVAPARIRVTGTMKFDTAQIADKIPGSDALAQAVGLNPESEKIWICGSTGPGEESLILNVYTRLKEQFPALRLVIVPRHPERFDEVAKLIASRSFPVFRRSQPTDAAAKSDPVILGDTMGELRKFYSLATVVFVGRSIVDLGPKQHGSDMIEPAGLAKPILIGPFTGNFTEVMNRFRENQALREVKSATQLLDAMREFLLAPIAAAEMGQRAQDVVLKNQGATLKHVELIRERLFPGSPVQKSLVDIPEDADEVDDEDAVVGEIADEE